MLAGGGKHTSDHLTVRGTDSQAPAVGQKVPARLLLQVVPTLEGPMYERDVAGVFVVRPANDPGVPVRAAAIVDQWELLQRQHRPAAASQFERRRGAHTAGTDHDDVER